MRLNIARSRFSPALALDLGPAERAAAATAQDASAAGSAAFPPHLYPPRGSRAIMGQDQLNVAGAGVAAILPGTAIVLDAGHIGVIDQIVIFADSPTLATRARWAILVNGVPAPGLGAISDIFALSSSQRLAFDKLGLMVGPGGRIEVAVTNLDGVGRVFGAQIVGWTYPARPGEKANA